MLTPHDRAAAHLCRPCPPLPGPASSASRAAVAAFDTLVDNDYVIDPGRYLARAELPSVIDLAAKRSALIDELGGLMTSSKRADDELRSLLERDR